MMAVIRKAKLFNWMDAELWCYLTSHNLYYVKLRADSKPRWRAFWFPTTKSENRQQDGKFYETYVRIRGQWAYLYRAVDSAGQTVDFRISPRRNVASAKAFFRKAVRCQGRSPLSITLDGYAASHRAVRELQQQGGLPELTKLRSSKYLNNLIEQDHRNIKSRPGAMPGLQSFASAAVTIRGVELMHRIRKGQFAPIPRFAPEPDAPA